jgi:hypothetical protein
MSAAATAEAVSVSDAVAVHAVSPLGPSTYEIEAAEQKRWMTWFGTPILIAAAFLGICFATGEAWWLGLVITTIVLDILVLVWLAMSSDTNGVIGEPSSGH